MNVFEHLLANILSGRYPPGSRLPAERDLARTLGASRPTLREALRRLGEWRMVEARRGSGVVVLATRDWSLQVLPAWLRHGAPGAGPRGLARMGADLLEVRRAIFLDMMRLVAPRVQAGAMAGARAAARRAWEARGDAGAFIALDFALLREVVEAARFLPALWLLNDIAGVYLEIARVIGGAAPVPPDYLETYEEVLTALERGDADSACRRVAAYLEAHDRRLLEMMGVVS